MRLPPGSDGEAPASLRGIDRGVYFGAVILIMTIHAVRVWLGADHVLGTPLAIGGMVVSLMAVAGRLLNIGLSAWFALGFLVPLVNLVIGMACLALPPEYWHTRRLDNIAMVVFGVFALTLVAVGVTMVL